MAIATATAILIAAGLGTAGIIGSSIASSSRAKKAAGQQQPAALPAPPKIDVGATQVSAAQKAAGQTKIIRRGMARSKSIFTNPLGIKGTAQTIKKQLLGQ